ncbi:THAP domain-containing protein 6-like, partial [Myzus persicae]
MSKICCVVNCSNTYKNTTNVKFYNFPNKPYQSELKKQWIYAVKRLDNNGQLWYPRPHSVICSEHFVGNKRSNDSNSPSYIPSLFPEVYKKKQVNIKQLSDRYIRTSNRQDKKLKMMINDVKSSEVEIIEPLQCESSNCVSNVGIQVMFD